MSQKTQKRQLLRRLSILCPRVQEIPNCDWSIFVVRYSKECCHRPNFARCGRATTMAARCFFQRSRLLSFTYFTLRIAKVCYEVLQASSLRRHLGRVRKLSGWSAVMVSLSNTKNSAAAANRSSEIGHDHNGHHLSRPKTKADRAKAL